MKIKLGFSTWDLLNKKPELEKNEVDFDGITLQGEKAIWSACDEDCCITYRQETLFHEIAHAMLFDLGYRKLSGDEVFIEGLSREIFAFATKNDIDKLLSYAER